MVVPILEQICLLQWTQNQKALQVLEDARRDAIHAHHDATRLYWRLMAATGATP